MSKFFILAGILLILVGLFWGVLAKTPFIGRLPGDIFIQKKNFTFYFPLTTSVILSLFLSLVFWFLARRVP